MARSWSCALRLLFLASLLLLCSALPPPPPGRGSASPVELTAADEAVLTRMCNPRAGPRPAWCEELHLIRRRALRGGGARHRHGGHHHHHQQQRAPAVPLPPPGRDEVDMRYGVSKRRVPTGPNPLHN